MAAFSQEKVSVSGGSQPRSLSMLIRWLSSISQLLLQILCLLCSGLDAHGSFFSFGCPSNAPASIFDSVSQLNTPVLLEFIGSRWWNSHSEDGSSIIRWSRRDLPISIWCWALPGVASGILIRDFFFAEKQLCLMDAGDKHDQSWCSKVLNSVVGALETHLPASKCSPYSQSTIGVVHEIQFYVILSSFTLCLPSELSE